MKHAVLAPSSAHRWLICTPSARLALRYPDMSSAYADEGTLAHSLGELLIQKALGLITVEYFKSTMMDIKKSEYYDKNMLKHCEDYRDYVLEVYNSKIANNNGQTVIQLEKKTDLSNYAPGAFGHRDCSIHDSTTLDIIDLKFGQGVYVDVKNNPQFMLYGLGAVGEIYDTCKIETITFHVFQPRMNNIASWTIRRVDLAEWYKTEVRDQAKDAYEGKGEYVPGEHCMFCPAKGNCKTFAVYNLELLIPGFPKPNGLKLEDVSEIVERGTIFTSWIKSVKDYALSQALKGVKYPGLKLVEGRSNRQIESTDEAIMQLILAGFKKTDVVKPTELKTLTDLEKLIGSIELNEILSDFIVKPTGAPTLVSNTDPRVSFGLKTALSAFSDLIKKK